MSALSYPMLFWLCCHVAEQPIIPLINPQQLQLHLMQQQLLQHMQMQQQPEPQLQIDSNLMAQIQALTAALMSRLGSGVGGGTGSVASEELVSTMEPSPVINKVSQRHAFWKSCFSP